MTEFERLLLLVGQVAAVVLAVFLVVRSMRERRRALWERRLNGEGEGAGEPDLAVGDVTLPKPPRDWAGRLDHAFDGMIHRTGLMLSAAQALALICLGGALLAGLAALWRGDWITASLGLLVGMATPLTVFLFLQARWRRRLQDQLPDALFLLARFLRAGMSLDQALALVGRHGPQPLAGLFRRCAEQMELGLAAPAALQSMAERVQLLDFNVFVSVVTLYRATGGNLALLLDRVAASTRDRNQFRGYFRTATALGRITGFFMSAAAPGLFLIYWLWQPEYIAQFFRTSGGVTALGIALGLEVIGVVWICALLRVNY